MVKKLNGLQLVQRYRKLLRLSETCPLNEAMVWKHWHVERALAQKILHSSPNDRPRITQWAYRQFYKELPWLKDPKFMAVQDPIQKRESPIIQLIGSKPQRILEIGSGTGELIQFLSQHGHWCIGTDLIKDRFFKKFRTPHLSFMEIDGVRLPMKKLSPLVDVVISSNVIEHFHPEDLDIHFQAVYQVLRPGGQYILKTPHGLFGPHGIEKVFGVRFSCGLHLHEYSFLEIQKAGEKNGFKSISAVFVWPRPLQKILGKWGRGVKTSTFYFKYLCGWEKIVRLINDRIFKDYFLFFLRFAFFPRQIFVILSK